MSLSGGGGGSGGGGLERLRNLASIPVDNFSQILTKLIILPIAAFFFGIRDIIDAVISTFTAPLFALAAGLGDLATAVLGGAAGIIQVGSTTSQGGISVFGIAGFPLAFVIVGAAALVFARVRQAESTSDWLPFSLGDLPTDYLGADEDEQ